MATSYPAMAISSLPITCVWMMVFLKDMDLFGNSLNGNSDYKPTRATSEKEIFDITTDTDSAVDLSVLDSSILPIGMVEVRANT